MSDTTELAGIAAETDFAGVAIVSVGGERVTELVMGFADRAQSRQITLDTVFATASATKGFTALTAASLVESGELAFDTTVGELIGNQLPLVDPSVTLEHLLGHTSGVGDYLDEDQPGDVDDHVLGISAHRLECPDDYLPLLAPHRQARTPGETFNYNNSGYVIVSVMIERASRCSFHELVKQRVFGPAKMSSAGFHRSDELPAKAALGYLANGRTNVFHLPIIGGGDGGAYVTVADMDAFWRALRSGQIVADEMVATMTQPRSSPPGDGPAYGLGFWLRPQVGSVMMEGMDAGVSFRSVTNSASDITYTVVSNSSAGTWPIARHLDERFGV